MKNNLHRRKSRDQFHVFPACAKVYCLFLSQSLAKLPTLFIWYYSTVVRATDYRVHGHFLANIQSVIMVFSAQLSYREGVNAHLVSPYLPPPFELCLPFHPLPSTTSKIFETCTQINRPSPLLSGKSCIRVENMPQRLYSKKNMV